MLQYGGDVQPAAAAGLGVALSEVFRGHCSASWVGECSTECCIYLSLPLSYVPSSCYVFLSLDTTF